MEGKKKILTEVTSIIRDVLKWKEEVSAETDLGEIGVDSINFMEIVVSIEEKYGFEFQDEMLSREKFEKIQDIVVYTAEMTGESEEVAYEKNTSL